MTLTHRPVEPADLPLICTFPQSAQELCYMFPIGTYPLTVEQLEEAIARRSDATVALLQGKVVAFANFYEWETGGRCSIGNVVVAPEARGRGVGRFMVTTMIETAFTRHNASEVSLFCFNHNTAGLLLYPSMGFRPVAIEERTNWDGQRIASIRMRLLREAYEATTK
ncbi:GNAT family N-acetyltransferase [Desulfovibrio mangrovi]|uniref:GNAT family N-acetyltransferase n=1 Tax=Desulfovibrio mangrovi TaxID=2976983 RepID=UPI002248727D|nr:GNAT family N-acetyltransferase [Desulfovibrio mangrovi]UZP65823.1 GNAT family N-acetyltransferase [Desulfovibrio mangrovi]